MLELINTVACLVLMGFSLPIAMVIGNRGMWMHRLSIIAVQIGLFMQLSNPLVGWLPQVTWTGVYLNAAAAIMLTIWSKRAWIFVKSYLGPDIQIRRRRTDHPGDMPVLHTYRGRAPKA